MNPNGPIQDPTLRGLLNAHRDEIFYSLNAHQVGIIQSFDEDKQTATVAIAAKRVVFNQTQTADETLQQTPTIIDYPILADVPVMFPRGGGAVLTFPVKKGDECLLCFNDRDLDAWFETGGAAVPNSPRAHSLSDAMAFVGLSSKATPIEDFATDAVELRFSEGKIGVTEDGKIIVTKSGASLKDAMDALFTALVGWVNTGGSTPNPATITAINAAKTQVDALLA